MQYNHSQSQEPSQPYFPPLPRIFIHGGRSDRATVPSTRNISVKGRGFTPPKKCGKLEDRHLEHHTFSQGGGFLWLGLGRVRRVWESGADKSGWRRGGPMCWDRGISISTIFGVLSSSGQYSTRLREIGSEGMTVVLRPPSPHPTTSK